MSKQQAQEIISRALADRRVYDSMVKREGEIWGAVLPKLHQSDAVAADQKASAELKMGRNYISLSKLLQERNLKPQRGLTLGCGAGRAERALMAAGVCTTFHGIDVALSAVEEARHEASSKKLPLTYEVADLNYVELPAQSYDLIIAQTCLHHVLRLEHVAEQVHKALRPGGVFWVHDFIGETQAQYDDARLKITSEILAILPEKFRQNTVTGRLIKDLKRAIPGKLSSPFEQIRSEEIPTVLGKWFNFEASNEFDTIMSYVAPPGTRAAFMANDDTKTIVELLFYIDQLLKEHRIMRPIGGQYLMTPKLLSS